MVEQEKPSVSSQVEQKQTVPPIDTTPQKQSKLPPKTEKKVEQLKERIKNHKQKLVEAFKKANKTSDPNVRSLRKKIKRLQRKVRAITGLKLQTILKKKGKTEKKEKKTS